MNKHYHLIGIGGIGMGTLASLLLSQGHRVSGSDLKENDLTVRLRKEGASVIIGHHASNVKQPDVVVYSSAVRMHNPELIEAESKNIPVVKRAKVLAELVNAKKGITIAGAHGKTTTTSMVSAVLIAAGLKPTTAVGGICAHHANLGAGDYFVAEADESDGTFLFFKPFISVITNIDFEHVDHYKNWEGILAAYTQFINCTAPGGTVIACGEDGRLNALLGRSTVKSFRYGLKPEFDLYAAHIKTHGFHTTFEVFSRTGKLGDFKLVVPGEHNVLNALAAISVGLALDVPVSTMQDALSAFTGVKRRFQLKGHTDGVMVVDDYGHHPAEITATIKAARGFEPKRLVVAFQPHRYSRTKFLLDEFVTALKLADAVVLTDIYEASEKVSEGVPTEVLLKKIQEQMGQGVIYLKKEHIVDYLTAESRPGDLVLFLGAGDIYHLSDHLVGKLEHKKAGV